MELKRKKGFTLLEAVITIGILVTVIALTTVVITNMVNIQKASSTQYEANEEISKAYKVVEEYVSFVSVNDNDVSFTYESSSPNSVTFSSSDYNFSLTYSSNTLSYGCDTTYSGSNDYLKTSNSVDLNHVESFTFTYFNDVKTLEVEITAYKQYSHRIFLLRTVA